MMRRLLLMACGVALQGCFLASDPFVAPGPTDAPGLEARVAADSSDVDAVVGLAVLRLEEGNADAARNLLTRANRFVPGDPAIPLLLAIAEERLGEYGSAHERYTSYADGRIGTLVGRAGLRAYAIEALAFRDQARSGLAGAPPEPPMTDPGLVAVLPFAHSGDADVEAQSAAVSTVVSWDVGDAGWRAMDVA
jgi:hypothetical protein